MATEKKAPAAAEKEAPTKSRLEAAMDQEIQVTGAEIPPGSYPAILVGFSEPWEMDNTKSKFRKEGDADTKTVFELEFALYDKEGVPALLESLCAFPDDGLANRRSTLYKTLKALATGSTLINEASGAFAKGTKLSSFVGKRCVLVVKKNDKDWPSVENIAPGMDGLKYPTMEEAKAIPRAEKSGDVPF